MVQKLEYPNLGFKKIREKSPNTNKTPEESPVELLIKYRPTPIYIEDISEHSLFKHDYHFVDGKLFRVLEKREEEEDKFVYITEEEITNFATISQWPIDGLPEYSDRKN